MLNKENKKLLLKIVKESVEEYVKNGKLKNFEIKGNELKTKQGAFITIRKEAKLRGCIGYIESNGMPLWEMIQDLSIKAATEDYRFAPVKTDELEKFEYEISLLTKPVEIDSWQNIKLGKHGVIIKKGFNSGVFLPQVAIETGWDLETFLGELCEKKAGLERDAYKDERMEILVFEVEILK